MDITDLSGYLSAAKSALDLFKGLREELPPGAKADEVQARIEQAEEALRTTKAQLAKALGYKLCQCTFPPQIMLSTGRHPDYGEEIFKCQNCNKQEPSEHHFAEMKEIDKHNASLGDSSWLAR